ncbi:hypothetical protein [Deinococcus ficus]|uniref:hypothetical protein n=1 Tax=Deinococcus ficus TaxID=317577 RepID=UPI000407203B|nr:hypothetical protein [Deinococcus ficus]
MLATLPSADAVRQGVRLSRGAARLWVTLHRLAVDVAKARAYTVAPEQVTFHLPAVTLAGVLDYHRSHLHRLADELRAAGLVDGGGHAQTVAGRNLYDGTVWAVATRPGAAVRVRGDEWRHQWRPGFAADYEGKSGAAAEMQRLQDEQADTEMKYRAAKARAAVPDGVLPPAVPSCLHSEPQGLRAVVEALPGLWLAHARHRAREVGKLASALCGALGEPERRRYWCRVLWDALRAENEGRAGVQVLAAQVSRLVADLAEGAPWRNAGAVLAARLRMA